jgi:cytochrome c5
MKARLMIFSSVLGLTAATGGFLFAAQNDSQGAKHATKHINKPSGTKQSDSGDEDGERVFAEHCSRCHNAPESFSPRIAGTITRHMRVRANLTPEEERAVLHFFNP